MESNVEMTVAGALLHEIRVANFRTARDLVVRPGRVCALIGEPGAGKSNALFAVRALLDPSFRLTPEDVRRGARRLSVSATLTDGRSVSLDAPEGAPPVLHFPAALRAGRLVAGGRDVRTRAIRATIRRSLERAPAPRVALVRSLEACAEDAEGVVFVIEEPELFLAPHGHRYLYRLVRRMAERENQILYTTHAPGLLDVAALDEVMLVSRDEQGVTKI